jgi:hypothetical protein
MLEFQELAGKKQRTYKSFTRQRQAAETRGRIIGASDRLLRTKGFSGMTIEAVGHPENGVSAITVSHPA